MLPRPTTFSDYRQMHIAGPYSCHSYDKGWMTDEEVAALPVVKVDIDENGKIIKREEPGR